MSCSPVWDVKMIQERMYKKIFKACALEYKDGMRAPVLKAFGKGEFAHKIVSIAESYGIQVTENQSDQLLEALSTLKVDTAIPPELYLAIARIFAYFYAEKE